MKTPCPNCPDGNEWGQNGPTGRACPTCHGTAELLVGDITVDAEVVTETINVLRELLAAKNKCRPNELWERVGTLLGQYEELE